MRIVYTEKDYMASYCLRLFRYLASEAVTRPDVIYGKLPALTLLLQTRVRPGYGFSPRDLAEWL